MTEKDFAHIVHSTKGIVLSAIGKNLSPRFYHAIDDIAQETYLRAYKSLVKNRFRGDSSLETWLFSIARNETLRMGERLAREEKKFKKTVQGYVDGMNKHSVPENDERDNLIDMIENLPESYRSVMDLLAKGYSEKEIAGKLDIKPGTVKSRTSRGREMLKRMMLNQEVRDED